MVDYFTSFVAAKVLEILKIVFFLFFLVFKKMFVFADRMMGPNKPKLIVSQETDSKSRYIGGSLDALTSHEAGK